MTPVVLPVDAGPSTLTPKSASAPEKTLRRTSTRRVWLILTPALNELGVGAAAPVRVMLDSLTEPCAPLSARTPSTALPGMPPAPMAARSTVSLRLPWP